MHLQKFVITSNIEDKFLHYYTINQSDYEYLCYISLITEQLKFDSIMKIPQITDFMIDGCGLLFARFIMLFPLNNGLFLEVRLQPSICTEKINQTLRKY